MVASPVLFALLAAGVVLARREPLVVDLTSGSFRGTQTENGTQRWLGIPFAEPPIDDLRFKAPQPIKHPRHEVQNASAFSHACPQPQTDTLGSTVGEDCLHLNVWRPNGTEAHSKLPVLVWFHGGFLMSGSASQPLFDPTRIIGRSVENGKPVMFVSTNYRVNTFGFLASADVPADDLNAGIQDMRAALQFVKDNIAVFGGDPEKVTIWGQSAGGGAVEAMVLYANELGLFRGAIMDSSSGPYRTSPPPEVFDEPGKAYSNLTLALNCTSPSTFKCLQNAPFEKILNASNTMLSALLNQNMWAPAVGPNGTIIPSLSSKRIKSGNFSHVPLIGGSNLNDGSVFATSLMNQNLTGDAEDAAFDAYILAQLIETDKVTEDIFDALHKVYPQNDTSLGAPYNTGDSLFDRGSAFYGDYSYTASRRRFFTEATKFQPTWAYMFAELLPGSDPTLGVTHGSELKLLFGPVAAEEELEFANMMLDFYLNFITDLNPSDAWAPFTTESKEILWLQRDNTTMIPDDFWAARVDLVNSDRLLEEFDR